MVENENGAVSQQHAIQAATYQAKDELSAVLTTLQTAAISAIALQQELVRTDYVLLPVYSHILTISSSSRNLVQTR